MHGRALGENRRLYATGRPRVPTRHNPQRGALPATAAGPRSDSTLHGACARPPNMHLVPVLASSLVTVAIGPWVPGRVKRTAGLVIHSVRRVLAH
jgi:hypothetical protein